MSERSAFTGHVSGDGSRIVFDAPALWGSRVARLKGKRVTVVLEREKAVRSPDQNRRYWGVVVPVVMEILSQGRVLPLSKDQTHWALKMAFLGQEETPLGPVPLSTTQLDVAQFSTYMERIEAHFVAEFGAVFPTDMDGLEALA